MSDDPCIAGRTGVTLWLEPGQHRWCTCGRSRSQPFCDDSHLGTAFEPLVFEVEERTRMKLCLCKRTEHAPRCDSAHFRLPGADD